MPFYPAFLDLAKKPVLVVGGGPVAFQKARALVKAGAQVTVVAPKVHDKFQNLKLKLVRRSFLQKDLSARPWLVVAATDDKALHGRLAKICASKRLWLNVVDEPAYCSFIVPAVVRRGLVTLAISTGGASPALAKALRRRLEKFLGPEYARLGRDLKRLRPRLLRIPMASRKSLMEGFLSDREIHGLRSGRGRANWRRRLGKALSRH